MRSVVYLFLLVEVASLVLQELSSTVGTDGLLLWSADSFALVSSGLS